MDDVTLLPWLCTYKEQRSCWGPAALPMYGGLARSHPDHLHPSRPCTGRCRHEWLNLTVGLYWFGHKAPPSWERHHVPRAPACDLRT